MELLAHMFSVPTMWQTVELVWILFWAAYGYRKHKKEQWFAEPVNAPSMFWDIGVAAALTTWLTTEFQLEGLLVVMKYHYLKEVLKHDRGLRYIIILSVASLIFLVMMIL